MPGTEYEKILSLEDKVRIKFETRNGKIIFFIVQYYALISGRWRTILRIDNCHGYPHQHTYHLRSKEFKVILDQDNDLAFNEANRYITKNFIKIKENYLNT